jgi:hypothetical protein
MIESTSIREHEKSGHQRGACSQDVRREPRQMRRANGRQAETDMKEHTLYRRPTWSGRIPYGPSKRLKRKSGGKSKGRRRVSPLSISNLPAPLETALPPCLTGASKETTSKAHPSELQTSSSAEVAGGREREAKRRKQKDLRGQRIYPCYDERPVRAEERGVSGVV